MSGRWPRNLQRFSGALGLAFVFVLLFPSRAAAYLDPGSGSFILQILAAALLGAGVAIRMQWRRIKRWFRPSGKGENEPPADE
jgi:hypothetical protein